MRAVVDRRGTRALGVLALATLLHFAQPAPISAQNTGGGGKASARAVATVLPIPGVHEARAMLARFRVDLAHEVRAMRREEGGVVLEARQETARGGVTVTVAHLGS